MTFCKAANNTSRARTDGERRKDLQRKDLLCVFYHEAKCLLAMAFCKAVNNTSVPARTANAVKTCNARICCVYYKHTAAICQ